MKITRKKHAATVPSMAMGDIAFNLLIFFVILARATDDSHLQWEPADAEQVTTGGVSTVSVVIDVENKYYINGEPVGIAQISPQINEILGDAPLEDRKVLLKVHRDATANHFEPVIEAVSEAGGQLFHILEEKRVSP
ncbi:Biopolymer transport protein ExbD/TolR [Novipirellula galeiformis]|uniref:Biopolymer transport protein ExbD/TolR n=1 Tax=Novipirellula galeiformis TaxID=2528004 RepID=A0A5C6CRZ0_9BACT|nr:biopolymer transporter ExbD [Novipirellula galeiformis]TWU26635.1 Biopolymer transport protein ExbD/TolR [Novipirellula galeiformis]